jgi:hypothetical protein
MGFAYHNIQRRQASYNNNKDGFYVGSCLLALRFSSLSLHFYTKREKNRLYNHSCSNKASGWRKEKKAKQIATLRTPVLFSTVNRTDSDLKP